MTSKWWYLLFLFSLAVGLNLECEEDISENLEHARLSISKANSAFLACQEKARRSVPSRILDCADILQRDNSSESGVYTIWPINRLTTNKGVNVYCDMKTDGGGWTVIQRRGTFGKPNDYFYRDWESFKKGFGKLDEDFWLGNDNIFALTNQKAYSVRFSMRDKIRTTAYALYNKFWIDDEFNQYTLHIADYSGTAGDAMSLHDKSKFSTKDRKNDKKIGDSCAVKFQSGWWFYNCFSANLNGMYNNNSYGIMWIPWRKTSYLPWTGIKIRPNNYQVHKWNFEKISYE